MRLVEDTLPQAFWNGIWQDMSYEMCGMFFVANFESSLEDSPAHATQIMLEWNKSDIFHKCIKWVREDADKIPNFSIYCVEI